ncbi:MAG TPA: hypothetical protein PK020_07310 [Ilumatobacteraceae bacterium]|nr:hypothetical protein [Ilumatobacteraceae bacterium]HRB02573.1 hypothetical protein [Ilumatobacteraceae bacterium]
MSSLESLRNSPSQLSELADSIAADGFASHASVAVGVANILDCEGFHHVAIDVVRDDTQPTIARVRAFGLMHGLALAAPQRLCTAAA